MDGPLPEPRIGDRERREVDATLRAALDDGVLTLSEYDERVAQCWAARTRSDLDLLTRDLPVRPATAVAAPVGATAPAKGSGHQRARSALLALVLAGAGLYLGGQVVTADSVALFGSPVVQIVPDEDRMEVGALFSSTTVVVPPDVRVRTAGAVVFGDMSCGDACTGPPGGREVVVEGRGAFSSIEVLTQSEFDRGVDVRDGGDDGGDGDGDDGGADGGGGDAGQDADEDD